MKDLLALTIDGQRIDAPDSVPQGSDSFSNVITVALALFVVLGIILALIFLIWGGITWATSGGDKAKIDKARKTIIFSIVGIIVIALSFVILQTIGQVLGSPFLAGFGK